MPAFCHSPYFATRYVVVSICLLIVCPMQCIHKVLLYQTCTDLLLEKRIWNNTEGRMERKKAIKPHKNNNLFQYPLSVQLSLPFWFKGHN